MEKFDAIRYIFTKSEEYHKNLLELTRSVSKLNDLLSFIVMCIDFAEKNIPDPILEKWADNNQSLQVLEDRVTLIIDNSPDESMNLIEHAIIASGSASSDYYSFLVTNYSNYETNDVRLKFQKITETYKDLLLNPITQSHVIDYLGEIDQRAQSKYLAASNQLMSMKPDEDAQGPLMVFRSVLEITIISLLKKSGLSKKELSDLHRADAIPTIASKLAKDEMSKIDLILVNGQYLDLWEKLSATKDTTLDRDRAIGLSLEITSILNLISQTLN